MMVHTCFYEKYIFLIYMWKASQTVHIVHFSIFKAAFFKDVRILFFC